MKNNSLHRSILLTAALAICGSPLLASSAFATVDRMIVFGDSLSDVDNLSTITSGLSPADPYYYTGRFSNGSIWVEQLEAQMNLQTSTLSFYKQFANPQASALRSQAVDFSKLGLNFSVGGSMTDGNVPTGSSALGLLGQIDTYRGLMNGATADSNSLYVVWAGANDYIYLTPEDFANPIPVVEKTVNNLLQSLESLATMGATQIAIGNLANLGNTPLAASIGEGAVNGLNAISAVHNSLLAEGLKNFQSKYKNVTLIDLDMNQTLGDILENPEDNGFISDAGTKSCTNINDLFNPPSVDELTKCNDPEDYVFWDNQHPTSALHNKIANYALREIRENVDPASVPEPSTVGTLGLLGFGLLWKSRRKK
jgi:phospholipase/lecithinase/hemolysin